jgi:hypothetical protein
MKSDWRCARCTAPTHSIPKRRIVNGQSCNRYCRKLQLFDSAHNNTESSELKGRAAHERLPGFIYLP